MKYRLLEPGEEIEPGDEMYLSNLERWQKIHEPLFGCECNRRVVRREFKPPEPQLVAKMKPIPGFEISIDGKSLGSFFVDSKWESFIKLINQKGQVVIIHGWDQPSDFINHIFSFGQKDEEREVSVVLLSPSLMPIEINHEVENEDDRNGLGVEEEDKSGAVSASTEEVGG